MTKKLELRKKKQQALSCLRAAAGVFVVTAVLPKVLWPDFLNAIAEAAMVGGLACWFAVVALFKRIPIPVISGRTAIIPNNKDQTAENWQHLANHAGKEST
jgi:uncharacterized membrane-anchored protein YjiN (DUF445 family)